MPDPTGPPSKAPIFVVLGLTGACVAFMAVSAAVKSRQRAADEAARQAQRATDEARLQAKKDALQAGASSWSSTAGLAEALEEAPTIARRLVAVDARKAEVDDVHLLFADDRAAGTPGEVGTVVLVEREDERVGAYLDEQGKDTGNQAFVRNAVVTLVDVAARRIVARRSFRGEDPPRTRTNESGDKYGPFPGPEIAAWVQSLPAR